MKSKKIFKYAIIDSFIFDIVKFHPTGIAASLIIKIVMKLLEEKKPEILPIGSFFIRNRLTVLTRKGLLFRCKSLEYNTNPPYLYFLEEPPFIEDYCEDCKNCIIDETIRDYENFKKPQHVRYCLLHERLVPRKHSCPSFEQSEDCHFFFANFEYEGHKRYNKIKCPYCKKSHTIKIPYWDAEAREERFTICFSCRCEVRRTRNGMFICMKRRSFPEEDIKIDESGFLYAVTSPLVKYIEMNSDLDCKDVFNVLKNKNGLQIATVYKKPKTIGFLADDEHPVCPNCATNEEKIQFPPILHGIKKSLKCSRCPGSIKSIELPKGYVRPKTRMRCHLDAIMQFEITGGDFTDEGYDNYLRLSAKGIKTFHIKHNVTLKKAIEDTSPESQERKRQLARQMIQAQAQSYVNTIVNHPMPKKRDQNKILKQLYKYMNELDDESISIAEIQSREGNIHKVTWMHDAEFLHESDHKGRGKGRYIRSTSKKKASRARTPFHCILNEFYYKLASEVRRELSNRGFRKFGMGSGLLHFSKDEGLLYDFIDQFRPIIRDFVIKWASWRDLTPLVQKATDDNGRQYYHISADNEYLALFESKFQEMLNRQFHYHSRELSFQFIIQEEAEKFRDFFLNNNMFIPFCIMR